MSSEGPLERQFDGAGEKIINSTATFDFWGVWFPRHQLMAAVNLKMYCGTEAATLDVFKQRLSKGQLQDGRPDPTQGFDITRLPMELWSLIREQLWATGWDDWATHGGYYLGSVDPVYERPELLFTIGDFDEEDDWMASMKEQLGTPERDMWIYQTNCADCKIFDTWFPRNDFLDRHQAKPWAGIISKVQCTCKVCSTRPAPHLDRPSRCSISNTDAIEPIVLEPRGLSIACVAHTSCAGVLCGVTLGHRRPRKPQPASTADGAGGGKDDSAQPATDNRTPSLPHPEDPAAHEQRQAMEASLRRLLADFPFLTPLGIDADVLKDRDAPLCQYHTPVHMVDYGGFVREEPDDEASTEHDTEDEMDED